MASVVRSLATRSHLCLAFVASVANAASDGCSVPAYTVTGTNCTVTFDDTTAEAYADSIFALDYTLGVESSHTWGLLTGMVAFMILVDRLQDYIERSVKGNASMEAFVDRVNAEFLVCVTQLIQLHH